MPKEDGIVHGDGELKDGGEGHGDEGNFANEDVGAHIEENHHAYREEEDEGGEPVIKEDEHGDNREDGGDGNVDVLFAGDEVFEIYNDGGHAGDEGLGAGYVADFRDSIQGGIFGGAGIKEDGEESFGFTLLIGGGEDFLDFVGEKFFGDAGGGFVVPEDVFDVVYGFDLIADFGNVGIGHIIKDDKGKGAGAEFFFEFFLADHGVNIGGEVAEEVVVDASRNHAK